VKRRGNQNVGTVDIAAVIDKRARFVNDPRYTMPIGQLTSAVWRRIYDRRQTGRQTFQRSSVNIGDVAGTDQRNANRSRPVPDRPIRRVTLLAAIAVTLGSAKPLTRPVHDPHFPCR